MNISRAGTKDSRRHCRPRRKKRQVISYREFLSKTRKQSEVIRVKRSQVMTKPGGYLIAALCCAFSKQH
jgi:hypothetical protein